MAGKYGGSAAVDIVTGASPELITNVSGKPVQVITGASVDDRRTIWDLKVSKRVGDWTLGRVGRPLLGGRLPFAGPMASR
jgi:hypothetical protein